MIRPIALCAALAALSAPLPARAQGPVSYCDGRLVADRFYHTIADSGRPRVHYFVQLRNTTRGTLSFTLTFNAVQIREGRPVNYQRIIAAERSTTVPLGIEPASSQFGQWAANLQYIDLRDATVITCN